MRKQVVAAAPLSSQPFPEGGILVAGEEKCPPWGLFGPSTGFWS